MNIYCALIPPIRQHWKAHNNAYPQKIVLNQFQHDQLMAIEAIGSGSGPRPDQFLGCKLEVDDTSTGVMVAVDGTVTPLPAFDTYEPSVA